MMRASLRAGTVLLALWVSAGCAAQGAQRRAPVPGGPFAVAGLVRDTGGLPVGGLPVRIVASERAVSLDERVDAEGLQVMAEGETAADGAYRLTFTVPPGPLYYYLSLYVPGRFDDVRFARPDRVDITDLILSGGSRVLDHNLAFHGKWPRVQELLKAYPVGSAKARIIRSYGIAEEIRKREGSPGVEEWWYYAKGKKFSFQGDKFLGENSFKPVLK